MGFSKDFVWGAAAASYQIEGGADERGDTVWDMFCRRPGAVDFGHNGSIACDHYHRYLEDIRIMKELGFKAYRFSFSWARLFPRDDQKPDPRGVEFYNRLIDALLDAGIEPYATIFHWDYPTYLYRKGGWLNPESPKWFADYTRAVVRLFSDRISHWFTENENQCFISLGHGTGDHAPGLRLSEEDVMICAHHSLVAHGLAVREIRENAVKPPLIGYAPVGDVRMPASDSEEDIEAAYNDMFKVYSPHYWGNMIWSEPIMTGRYPDEILDYFKSINLSVTDEDMAVIGEPIDFMGMNIYTADTVNAAGRVEPAVGHEQTAMDWQINNDALYWGTKFYYRRYKKPMIVTENGIAINDVVSADGQVHDPQRSEFIRRYLSGLKRSADEGCDIRGYFYWSILDNFEWARGYTKRFGLVYVDYQTQRRIIKDSARYYADIIKNNGDNL